jgi:(p)ppGpp synthase/HD superfamily hydrolase
MPNVHYLVYCSFAGVTSIVLECGRNEDEVVAALLHGAIEDRGGAATREEIRRRFGNTVVEIEYLATGTS